MRSEEPLSVGRTTVQTWWVLRVSRRLAQEVWMPWSSRVFSMAMSRW